MNQNFSKIIYQSGEFLFQTLTGKFLTESQIQSVTTKVLGQFFIGYSNLNQQEADAENQISEARVHITEAARIINSLQDELEGQVLQLDSLANEIEDKKKLAQRYQLLAQTNQETFSAFRQELEESLRQELTAQAQKGKNARRVVNIAIWIVTLVLGAALGAYFEISFEPLFFQSIQLFLIR